ncbi:MAG: hypothetical protein AAB513_02675 [Patescibacteria group bacterium]
MSKLESLAQSEPERLDKIVEEEFLALELTAEKVILALDSLADKNLLRRRSKVDLEILVDKLIRGVEEAVNLYKANKISAEKVLNMISELKINFEISGVNETQIPVSAEAGRVILERMEKLAELEKEKSGKGDGEVEEEKLAA